MMLTNRELSLATLARQHLLERADVPAARMIEHLVGLQAQAPMPPYFGLWSRIAGFDPAELSTLLLDRSVVRIVLMRGTVHLVTAADAAFLRPAVQVIMDRDLRTNQLHADNLAGVDVGAVAAYGRAAIEATPMTGPELKPLLAGEFPGVDPASLVHAMRALLPLVQVPPRALWGRSGQPRYAMLQDWTGLELDSAPPLERMVLRYLAAFGPASVADAQAWSGLTRLSEVVDRLRPQLQRFTSESGAELFDLPGAPRPAPTRPIPTRILAPFDNVLLSHADRTRILSADAKRQLVTANGVFPPIVLLDGLVAGQGRVTKDASTALFTVTPYRRLTKAEQASVTAEARRFLKFALPQANSREVAFS